MLGVHRADDLRPTLQQSAQPELGLPAAASDVLAQRTAQQLGVAVVRAGTGALLLELRTRFATPGCHPAWGWQDARDIMGDPGGHLDAEGVVVVGDNRVGEDQGVVLFADTRLVIGGRRPELVVRTPELVRTPEHQPAPVGLRAPQMG